ncbi:MAG: hypothetical protein Hyperionvirus13_23 [Hyperionvirus sp.]|uniref:Uncharacterized protein n=1 Tax=Hyperionvirus sp. TaxID=2487770 RepID=A0A3G5A9D9_9VIRU|nr:MAG: hypothetical protein Hyperionvirus13_23 [Hyperionvirus sp.]
MKRKKSNGSCGPNKILRRTYVRRPSIKSIGRDTDDMTQARGTVVPAKCTRRRRSRRQGPRRSKDRIVPATPQLLQQYKYDQFDPPGKRHKSLNKATRLLGAQVVYEELKNYNAFPKKNSEEHDNISDDLTYLKRNNTIRKRRTSKKRGLIHI